MKKFFIFLTLFSFSTMLRSSDNETEKHIKRIAIYTVNIALDINEHHVRSTFPRLSSEQILTKNIHETFKSYREFSRPMSEYIHILDTHKIQEASAWAPFLSRYMEKYCKQLRSASNKITRQTKERARERALEKIRAIARSQPK